MRAAITAAGLFAAAGVSAHGGLSIDDDLCKLRVGPFNMHFTGYQPQRDGNREFCEDIPGVGHTIVVMDALDADLRGLPIEVRIIRDPGSPEAENVQGTQLDALTVVHLPPKVYETGSVPLEYSFATPGHFVGLVKAGNQGEFVSRFPFSVGIEKHTYWHYVLALGAALMGFGFYRYSGRVRERLGAQAHIQAGDPPSAQG